MENKRWLDKLNNCIANELLTSHQREGKPLQTATTTDIYVGDELEFCICMI